MSYLKSMAGALAIAGVAAAAPANAIEKELLDVLLANHAITQAQYDELLDGAKQFDTRAEKLAWAERIHIKGDMRLRQERIDVDGKGRKNDRQRIRARLGIYAAANDEVDVGLRLATGGGSTSTNQSLGNNFNGKGLFVDRAWIDWHPAAIGNLHLLGGKIAQPWISVEQLIWDGDTNPEGVAFKYATDLGAAKLLTHAGYYIATNNADGNGPQFRNDLNLFSAQAAIQAPLGEAASTTFGFSVYNFDDEVAGNPASGGNDATQFGLYELFGKLALKQLPLPLTLYGQWVTNNDANGPHDNEDTAWLLGVKTKIAKKWSLNYNYRDVERNAVPDTFNDSDFAAGLTDSRGHKFGIKYAINKNFSFGATYFRTKSDAANPGVNDANVNTLQVDLVAKYK